MLVLEKTFIACFTSKCNFGFKTFSKSYHYPSTCLPQLLEVMLKSTHTGAIEKQRHHRH